VPDRLYHGTCGSRLDSIRRDGLRCDLAKESSLSDNAVYFAVDPAAAASIAKRRAAKHGGEPVVLSVDPTELDGRSLALDVNLATGRGWSNAVAYWETIPPDLITVEPLEFVRSQPKPEMVFDDPEAGKDRIAFDVQWGRAAEFLPETPSTPILG